MWNKPWGYKEGVAINAGLLIIGLLLQVTAGEVKFELLSYPVNFFLHVILILGLTAIHFLFKKSYFFRCISTLEFALPTMGFVVILVIFMGLTPQFQSDVKISGLIGRFGLLKMLSAWYFVLIFLWLIIILCAVIIRRITNFRLKKDIPFLLNHLGLFIALVCGVLGSADMQRLKLTASVGNPEWRAIDNKQNIVELALAIELNNFTIEEYPPKLVLIDNETGKIGSGKKSKSILADEKTTTGNLNDWQITIDKRIDNAAMIFSGDTVKYVEYYSYGSTCAIYVNVLNINTLYQNEGWVSCGNFMFSPKALKLDEKTSLIMLPLEPRRYVSDVTIFTQSEKEINAIIEVNKPLKVEGWKIYQVSYDEKRGKWSEISVFELIRDPWLPAVYTGILMMMAGVLSMIIFISKPDKPKPNRLNSKKIMKTYRKEILINTNQRREFINITSQIQKCLRESGIKEGLLLCNSMHITSSVFINDDESGLHKDFEGWLEKLAPEKPHSQYLHNGYEDNADAHLKRQIMGREVIVAITNGNLDFGTWEQIFYGEFDGMRTKRVLVKIVGE